MERSRNPDDERVQVVSKEQLLQVLAELIAERIGGGEDYATRETGKSAGGAYYDFERDILGLSNKLLELEYSFRSLGSGGPGMDASRDLRKFLKSISVLYNKNFQDIHLTSEARNASSDHHPRNVLSDRADRFRKLSNSCNKLNSSLLNFIDMYHNDHLSRLLQEIQEQSEFLATIIGNDPSITRSDVHDEMAKLGAHVRECSKELSVFINKGIPMIKDAQAHFTSRYLTMTTIAAFFSGVTATMIQFTYQVTSNPLDVAVNTLLLSSLVFSVASAAHSLLVMAWRQSCVPSPEFLHPFWARSWLLKGPMICLTMSGAQFSMGLCLFVYLSNQSIATCILVPFFGAIHAIALIAFSIWFATERWRFRNSAGVGWKATAGSMSMAVIDLAVRLFKALGCHSDGGEGSVSRVSSSKDCVAGRSPTRGLASNGFGVRKGAGSRGDAFIDVEASSSTSNSRFRTVGASPSSPLSPGQSPGNRHGHVTSEGYLSCPPSSPLILKQPNPSSRLHANSPVFLKASRDGDESVEIPIQVVTPTSSMPPSPLSAYARDDFKGETCTVNISAVTVPHTNEKIDNSPIARSQRYVHPSASESSMARSELPGISGIERRQSITGHGRGLDEYLRLERSVHAETAEQMGRERTIIIAPNSSRGSSSIYSDVDAAYSPRTGGYMSPPGLGDAPFGFRLDNGSMQGRPREEVPSDNYIAPFNELRQGDDSHPQFPANIWAGRDYTRLSILHRCLAKGKPVPWPVVDEHVSTASAVRSSITGVSTVLGQDSDNADEPRRSVSEMEWNHRQFPRI